tara:strand:- start:118 stop:357 length:240 start_codon:yes stop_codon:yes gene_type:complete
MNLDKRINKLRIARNKALELSQYVYKNNLDIYTSENNIDIDSAIYYDVFKTLDEEYNKLNRKLEDIQASKLMNVENEGE